MCTQCRLQAFKELQLKMQPQRQNTTAAYIIIIVGVLETMCIVHTLHMYSRAYLFGHRIQLSSITLLQFDRGISFSC